MEVVIEGYDLVPRVAFEAKFEVTTPDFVVYPCPSGARRYVVKETVFSLSR
jgi:hypothetical protein